MKDIETGMSFPPNTRLINARLRSLKKSRSFPPNTRLINSCRVIRDALMMFPAEYAAYQCGQGINEVDTMFPAEYAAYQPDQREIWAVDEVSRRIRGLSTFFSISARISARFPPNTRLINNVRLIRASCRSFPPNTRLIK